ncbi:MAG: TrmH family RNA methyltransferase [Candidatus Paceibacterota bacterium]
MIKLDAKALRHAPALTEQAEQTKHLKRNPIYIVVDNVLDTYNVGAIFRLADAAAVRKVFLCGGTEKPPNHRIKKASVNTTEWVHWEHRESAIEVIKELRSQIPDIQIIAVEQSNKSKPYDKIKYLFPIVLIVGHETDGVSKEALEASDFIAEIPMWGVNMSLNVMISLGIMLYKVMEHKQNI